MTEAPLRRIANGAAVDAPVQIDSRARAEILIAVLLAVFLSALDQTIVGTALPRIVNDLNGNEFYTWVVTIYLLTATVSGPIYGKLSDLFGRRPMVMFGVSLFLIGSALSGISQEMWQLVAARGLQGLGAGAIFPIALAVIGDLFTPAERGKYQGLFGAVFGISALIGPALGGFLTDNFSWHWVFFVNLPVGAVALLIIWRLLPPIKHPERARSIDYLGSVVFAAALVPILIGLTNKRTLEWNDPLVGGLILVGLAFSALFVWVESRASEPILPLSLFRNRSISVSLIAVFLASFGFFGAIIFIPLWFQTVLGSSATESGYQILPLLAGLIVSSVVSGQVISRTGRYRWLIVVSMALVAVGIALMTQLRGDTSLGEMLPWMVVAGMGIGPSLAAFTIVVQNAAPFAQLGAATGALTFFRQVGGTVGLALGGTLFGSALIRELPTQMTAAGVPPEIASFAPSGAGSDFSSIGDLGAQILAAVPEQARAAVEPFVPNIVNGFNNAFSLAIGSALWIGVVAAIGATAATLFFLPELPLRTHHGPARAESAEAEGSEPAPMVAFD
ncbi:MAG: MFS transporter [Chloroflexota bacterium]|nr:MFS transporter [Chloroflexota bacterium]